MRVNIYEDEKGKYPFNQWFDSISDKRTRARIYIRLQRVRIGNLGNFNSVGAGLFELILDFGPGFRIYYGMIGKEMILLLGGGSKKSQTRDIKKAKENWLDHKSRQRLCEKK